MVAQITLHRYVGFLQAGSVDLFGVDVCLAQEGNKDFPTLFQGALLGIGRRSEF